MMSRTWHRTYPYIRFADTSLARASSHISFCGNWAYYSEHLKMVTSRDQGPPNSPRMRVFVLTVGSCYSGRGLCVVRDHRRKTLISGCELWKVTVPTEPVRLDLFWSRSGSGSDGRDGSVWPLRTHQRELFLDSAVDPQDNGISAQGTSLYRKAWQAACAVVLYGASPVVCRAENTVRLGTS